MALAPQNIPNITPTSQQAQTIDKKSMVTLLSPVNEVAYDSVGPAAQAKKPLRSLCTTHDKPIEAFCLFDRQLLCIDCILSDDHKGRTSKERHDMVSVEKASETEREQLQSKFKQSEEA